MQMMGKAIVAKGLPTIRIATLLIVYLYDFARRRRTSLSGLYFAVRQGNQRRDGKRRRRQRRFYSVICLYPQGRIGDRLRDRAQELFDEWSRTREVEESIDDSDQAA